MKISGRQGVVVVELLNGDEVKVLFGEWTFDADSRQLHHGAEEVHLSTKAFDLLKLLIDARPRVVSKADLQEALWPGIFVSEANLFTLVSEIRGAIDEDARHSRFVRTVHGVGYAFSGDAIETSSSARPARAATPACVLIWESRQFALTVGEHVIGRDIDVAVTLDSATVSRRHARLRVTQDAATIEDLDSKNGTFVNDARASGEKSIADGDRIRIGSLLLTFRRVGSAFSTETERVDTPY
jgi:DNA-binding winged helix-turn-helix (wHTH) protein